MRHGALSSTSASECIWNLLQIDWDHMHISEYVYFEKDPQNFIG